MAYIGNQAQGSFSTTVKDTFNGTGSQTEYTLSQGAVANNLDVFVNNVRQEPGVAYTCSGKTLTFTAAPASGTGNIYVVNRGPAELTATFPADQSLEAYSGDFTTDVTIGGDLTVDTDTLVVDSTNDRVGVNVSPATALDVNGTINVRTNGYQFGRITTNNVNADTGGLSFQTISGGSFSERMRILPSGGITFNGDTSTANALDDYEEGTWTPTYISTSGNPTVSYEIQNGEYVKIGRQVIARCEIRTNSVSGGSGIVSVGGLPFTANSNAGTRAGTVIIGYATAFSIDNPQAGYQNNNTTSFVLGHNSTNTNANSPLSGTLDVTNLATGSNANFLMATLIYTAT